MKPDDYGKTWTHISRERAVLGDQRATLETELSEISNKIAHLDEILTHLAPLAGMPFEDNIFGLGITDAIRFILKGSQERMSATDVRHALVEKGFSLTGLTAPMASIYKVLSRLVSDSGEVDRERDEEGRVFFRWKHPTEITDDDIPF